HLSAAAVAPVVPLATRRRRWAGAGLVAAAAVVLIGVGLGPLVDSWQGGFSAGDGAGDDTAVSSLDEGGDAAEESGAEELNRSYSAQDQSDQDRPMSGIPEAAILGAPKVRPRHFERDVTAARDLPALLSSQSQPVPEPADSRARALADAGCGPAPGPDERAVAVTYQRQPALLLFRAPADDSQVVELHLCRDVGPERVTTLPAP
ncbi:hypothetical protein, partial [Nocardioides sp.]|uniref:hypothetical protein n=1 Tax=Nocardioides sp. TaxID=35761 RepID=UPI00273396CA